MDWLAQAIEDYYSSVEFLNNPHHANDCRNAALISLAEQTKHLVDRVDIHLLALVEEQRKTNEMLVKLADLNMWRDLDTTLDNFTQHPRPAREDDAE